LELKRVVYRIDDTQAEWYRGGNACIVSSEAMHFCLLEEKMKKKLSIGTAIAIGITLFSMFFGSGNLIFPPFMGFQAGSSTWKGMLGFSITAILFPVLAVIVIARFGDLTHLAARVGKRFAMLFTILVFLSLGPGLAIPRNAAVSFEMAVTPFVENVSVGMRIAYSLVFFGIAYFLSARPDKLTDSLGRILGPILLGLMIVVAVFCFTNVTGTLPEASGAYAADQTLQGFLDGYLTMDTLAALNFGNIIALNVASEGIREKKGIVHYTVIAGWIAGGLLFVIYTLMAHVGSLSGIISSEAANGANVLTNIVNYLFGTPGLILLAVIYILACLTTCIGLLCSCAEYFASISKMNYQGWVALFAVSSFFMSVVGLDQILTISVPILNAMYPIAIVLVILGLLDNKLKGHENVYKMSILFTGIVSIIYSLSSAGFDIPYISKLITSIPPCTDLCWIIPALIGFAIGWFMPSHAEAPQKEADLLEAQQ
jgi:LIVCS family branched-chain amino acid:cation transporter